MKRCCRSVVTGRVQGVYYRGTAVRQAQSLGIVGYARNRADGSVEVVACGERAAVDDFVAWLWEGSVAAKVTGVVTEELSLDVGQKLTGFSAG
ncbi:MAG: acylphosphatase [Steroidobacteraceae bacterium]